MADNVASLVIHIDGKQLTVATGQMVAMQKAAKKMANELDGVKESGKNLHGPAKRSLTELSSSFKTTGRDLSRYITLPMLAIGAASIKMATSLTEGLGQVETLIAGTGDRIYELEQIVKDTAVSTGKSFADLNRGLYETISAFQDGADTAGRFDTAVRASIAGGSTVLDSVKLLSAVTKAYGDTTTAATEKVADLAFEAVRLGQTTFPEMAQAITQVTANSARLGVSQEELFSVYATLTGVTGDASIVTTGFNRALIALANPTEDLIKLYSQYTDEQGRVVKTGDQFLKAIGGIGNAFTVINDAANKTGKPIEDFITRETGVRIALQLAGKSATSFAEKSALVAASVGAADEAFIAATTGIDMWRFELNKTISRLKVVGAEIGEILLPKLVSLLQGVASVAEAFTRMNSASQEMIIKIAGVVAAIGPLLIAFGSILRLTETIKNLQMLNVFAGLGKFLASPAGVAIIIAAAVAFGAVAIAMKKNKEYVEELNGAMAGSKGLFQAYEQLERVLNDATTAEEDKLQIMYDFVQKYPELREQVYQQADAMRVLGSETGTTALEMENIYKAMLQINKQRFLDTATRDIKDAKKAARDYYVALDDLESPIKGLLENAFTGLNPTQIAREGERIMFQIANDMITGGFKGLEGEALNERLLQIFNIDATQIPDYMIGAFNNLRVGIQETTEAYSDFAGEVDNLSDIAGEFGFDAADVLLSKDGDLSKWRDYFVDLIIKTKKAIAEETDDGNDDDPILGDPDTIQKRLKTWADYFADITGIAGEAFAKIEYDDKGNAVGFLGGRNGILAADAYAKAFADQMKKQSDIANAVGNAFTASDKLSIVKSQIDEAMGELTETIALNVREADLNKEGLQFNIADLLSSDEASVERMLSVFELSDNVIQGIVKSIKELKSESNSLTVNTIMDEYAQAIEDANIEQKISDVSLGMMFDYDEASLGALQDSLTKLYEQKSLLQDQEMMSPEDEATLARVLALIWSTNNAIEDATNKFKYAKEELDSFSSLGTILADTVFPKLVNGFQKMGMDLFSAQMGAAALGTVLGGVLDTAIDGFSNLGYEFGRLNALEAQGVDVTKQRNDAWGELAKTIADSISTLLMQVGLSLIGAGATAELGPDWGLIGLGLALWGGGLGGKMIGGYTQGQIDAKEQATANAHGGVYSGNDRITKYAKGGVLGDYVNKIVDKPTYFANGSALMGEKSAEAIMPLTRDSKGDLAVSAVGMGGGSTNVQINVNNYASDSTEANVTQNSDGSFDVNIIKKMVAGAIADGSTDNAMRSRYGTRPKGIN